MTTAYSIYVYTYARIFTIVNCAYMHTYTHMHIYTYTHIHRYARIAYVCIVLSLQLGRQKLARVLVQHDCATRFRDQLARSSCAIILREPLPIAFSACASNMRELFARKPRTGNLREQTARAACASSLRSELARVLFCCISCLRQCLARAACASRFLTVRHLTFRYLACIYIYIYI